MNESNCFRKYAPISFAPLFLLLYFFYAVDYQRALSFVLTGFNLNRPTEHSKRNMKDLITDASQLGFCNLVS